MEKFFLGYVTHTHVDSRPEFEPSALRWQDRLLNARSGEQADDGRIREHGAGLRDSKKKPINFDDNSRKKRNPPIFWVRHTHTCSDNCFPYVTAPSSYKQVSARTTPKLAQLKSCMTSSLAMCTAHSRIWQIKIVSCHSIWQTKLESCHSCLFEVNTHTRTHTHTLGYYSKDSWPRDNLDYNFQYLNLGCNS